LVQLDDATMRRLKQVAPSAKRQRTEFIRRAVKDAIRRQEFAQMRAAYRQKPDSAAEADDWSSAGAFAR
jgi:predicted transcriptional regulator